MVLTTDLYYKGLSVRAVANHIWQVYNVRKSPSTLHRWVLRLTRIVVDATKGITPAVGTRWLGDEMVIKVKGRKSYLWNVLDYRTRYHIAAIVAEGRSHQEAYEVIQKAISKGGITPNQFVSDGLPSYKKGIQMTGKKIKHISGVGIQNHPNNNRIERRHGSMRGWIRNKRGLKGRTQEVIDGSLVYYNYLRPHQGLKNRPPSPTFEGDKWTSVLSGRRRRSRSSGA
jgi:transposase-like protein